MTMSRHGSNFRVASILIVVIVPLLLAVVGLQLAAAAYEIDGALQVTSADLGITKIATPDLVAAGQQVTYTLNVDNSGTMSATNVVVSDSLPGGVALAAWSTNVIGATCDGSVDPIVCLLGDLEAGASALITLVVDVDPGIAGVLVNSAEVGSDVVDADSSNNSDSAPITVSASADLSLVKTAHASVVFAGHPVTYTLTISNSGPSTANDITVIDELPKATTYISGDGANCSRHARTITCLLTGPLQPGESTIITLVFGINTEVIGPLINEAEVSSDVPDEVPGNNLGSALVTVIAEADLSLVKTASANDVAAGERLTYTLTIQNAGPADASNVIISDTLPAGTSFVSASGASCSEVNNILSCSMPDPIAAGGSQDVSLVVDVDAAASGTIINYAEVSSDSGDNSPGDNLDSASVTVNAEADLSLVKTASSSNVLAGQRLTYTLAIDNAGPSDAFNVIISDTLPAETAYVSANGAACSDSSNVLSCSVPGTIAAGASTFVTLVVDVDIAASGTLINVAEVSSDAADNSTDNNLDSASVTVNALADLSLIKTASSSTVVAGERLTYTLAIDNAGPASAANVVISDTLPAGASFVSASGATCSDTNNLLDCSVPGSIAAGGSRLVNVVVDVDASASGTLINYAEVSSDAFDNSTGDNLDSASVTVTAEADLSLTKAASSGNVFAGERLTYTLTVHNAGPSDAFNVIISDTLPAGTSYVSAGGAACSDTSSLLSCSLAGSLAAGASTFVTLVVDVDAASGTLINYAEVSSDAADNTIANNLDSALVTVNAVADLSLVKTASLSNVLAGDRLTYTLAIDNAGPSDALNIIISDTLPAGTSFVSAFGASCSDASNLLDCSVPGSIAAGGSRLVTVVVDVGAATSGTLINYAEVSSAAADNSIGDNLDSASVTVIAEADLSLIKTASASNVVAGERLTYTLTVHNAGPADAFNVIISDTLPTGTSYVSASGAACSDTNNLLNCPLPEPIIAGASAVVTVVVDIDTSAQGMVINYAEVSSDSLDGSMAANLDSASTIIHHRVLLPVIQNGSPTGEPNDTCEQAYGITANDYFWFMPNDVFDWYQFDLSFAGKMTVELTNFTPINGQVAVYKSADCDNRKDGFLGNVGDPGTTKILNLGLQEAGHYYIFVGSDGALSETQPYRLRVLVEPGGP